MNSTPILVEKLSSQSLLQFLKFFDGEAFSDNPNGSSCYCQCFYEKVKVSGATIASTHAVDRCLCISPQGSPFIERMRTVAFTSVASFDLQ